MFDNERSSAALSAYCASRMLSDIEAAYRVGGSNSSTTCCPREVSWVGTPNDTTVALNVDGSALQQPGHSGFGGLLRDHSGSFNFGFYRSAGQASVLHAEILVIMHGLRLCWEHGFRRVICYSDSLNAVKLNHEGVPHCHPLANEISIIEKHIHMDWSCMLFHTLREGNQCADQLAKFGAITDDQLVVIQQPPPEMGSLLLTDALGVSFTWE